MLKRFAFLLLFFVVSCVPSHVQTTSIDCTSEHRLPSSDAPNSVENDFGRLVLWEQNAFPIRVVMDPNMREKRKRVVQQAVLEWNRTTNLEVFTLEEGPETSEEGVIWINEEALPENECGHQLYGLASRFYRRDFFNIKMSISHGRIRLHTGVPDDRVLSTAIHELGHVLGLHHDRELESIMYPHNNGQRGSITDEDRDYVIMMITGPRPEPYMVMNIEGL